MCNMLLYTDFLGVVIIQDQHLLKVVALVKVVVAALLARVTDRFLPHLDRSL